jgi:choice-of-anchor A domain-containing protein
MFAQARNSTSRIAPKAIIIAAAIAAAAAVPAEAGISNWDFNVFSRSTIGSSGQGYGSDFQGSSGSVGDAYFTNFGMRTVSSSSPTLPAAFYGGGTFNLTSGTVYSGGINVAGSVNLSNVTVNGGIRSGGSLNGGSGTINGNVSLAGTRNTGNQMTINGSVTTSTPYSAPLDLSGVSSYFAQASAFAASLAATTNYTNNYGQLIVNASGPRTVVNFSPSDYANAWGIRVDGPGTVVINVGGQSVSVASKTWSYNNGAASTSTLLNFHQATALSLSGGHNVNILAPNAVTNFSNGVINGNLVVGKLTGGGQVNWVGAFSGGSVVPTPASAAIAVTSLVVMAGRRRRS